MATLSRLDTFDAIHPAWRDRVVQLCSWTGCWPQSVWRSRDLQALWYWCSRNNCPSGNGCHGVPGNCPGANPPDLSYHEYEEDGVPAALATDLSYPSQDAINNAHNIAENLGLHFPLASEPWHVQPVECPGSTSPAPRWTPFGPLSDYIRFMPKEDPWDGLFVPLLIN